MPLPKKKTYQIQVSITDCMVNFEVPADSLESALSEGRKQLASREFSLFADGIEVCDYAAEVTGVY
jgi:hypothetical protein